MNLTAMIESGTANPVLLIAAAMLLGGLHGLEPGHSKTMMAAYIVAIRGTVWQAVLLGLSAAVAHSIIVWVLAYAALSWGNELIGEDLEPVFTAASGIIILGIATWMFVQVRRNAVATHYHSGAHHHDHHDHAHDHHHHNHQDADNEPLDAHALAHAREIEQRIGTSKTSSWQTILFGFSGGLIPCPGAITVFLLCLHLGQLVMGVAFVSAFSIGLAITLVLFGTAAALSLKAIGKHMKRFDPLLRAASLVSAALIAVIGYVMLYSAFTGGLHGHA